MLLASEARKACDIGSHSYEAPRITGTIPEALKYAFRKNVESLMLPRDEEFESGPFQKVAITTGEPWDSTWIRDELDAVNLSTALFRLRKGNFGESLSYFGIPAYVRIPWRKVDPDELNVLIEERVTLENPLLDRVLGECKLPRQPLQVGVKTIDLVSFALRFGVKRDSNLDPFIERTKRELAAAWKITKGNMFILVEAPVLNILANARRNDPGLMAWYLEAYRKLISVFPPGCPWGFHFCNGRLGRNALGNHGIPKLLGAAEYIYHSEETVEMSNYMLHGLEEAGLIPDVAHYPHALGSEPPFIDEAHFLPFRYLYLHQKTEYYGGSVSHHLDLAQHKDTYQMQDDLLRMKNRPQGRSGMAPTCGWGSSTLLEQDQERYLQSKIAYV